MTRRRHRSLLSRRNLLYGSGVCLALPWLESLVPQARAQALTFPTRFLPIFFPNGAADQWWDFGPNAALGMPQFSPLLAPFAPLEGKLNVFEGLGNYRWSVTGPSVTPANAKLTGAFLTCVDIDQGQEGPLQGVSVDQVVAQGIGTQTGITSLQLGLATSVGDCEERDCAFSQAISWAGPGQPLPKQIDPQIVFDTLFGRDASFTSADQAEAERRRALHLSVLDYTLASAETLRTQLSVSDRERVDQFLNSVREVETRVNALPIRPGCDPPERPTLTAHTGLANGDEGYSREEHASIMNTLIVLALQCDITRVISHMLDDAKSEFVYDHVTLQDFGGPIAGVTTVGNFYAMGRTVSNANPYASINYWLNSKVAELCQMLDAVVEGEGTLLDHSVVFYASNYHGTLEAAAQIPALLIGGGNGALRTGQFVRFSAAPDDAQFRDLYSTLLFDCFGVNPDSFGADTEGALPRRVESILA